jgi:hypothetical protein
MQVSGSKVHDNGILESQLPKAVLTSSLSQPLVALEGRFSNHWLLSVKVPNSGGLETPQWLSPSFCIVRNPNGAPNVARSAKAARAKTMLCGHEVCR